MAKRPDPAVIARGTAKKSQFPLTPSTATSGDKGSSPAAGIASQPFQHKTSPEADPLTSSGADDKSVYHEILLKIVPFEGLFNRLTSGSSNNTVISNVVDEGVLDGPDDRIFSLLLLENTLQLVVNETPVSDWVDGNSSLSIPSVSLDEDIAAEPLETGAVTTHTHTSSLKLIPSDQVSWSQIKGNSSLSLIDQEIRSGLDRTHIVENSIAYRFEDITLSLKVADNHESLLVDGNSSITNALLEVENTRQPAQIITPAMRDELSTWFDSYLFVKATESVTASSIEGNTSLSVISDEVGDAVTPQIIEGGSEFTHNVESVLYLKPYDTSSSSWVYGQTSLSVIYKELKDSADSEIFDIDAAEYVRDVHLNISVSESVSNSVVSGQSTLSNVLVRNETEKLDIDILPSDGEYNYIPIVKHPPCDVHLLIGVSDIGLVDDNISLAQGNNFIYWEGSTVSQPFIDSKSRFYDQIIKLDSVPYPNTFQDFFLASLREINEFMVVMRGYNSQSSTPYYVWDDQIEYLEIIYLPTNLDNKSREPYVLRRLVSNAVAGLVDGNTTQSLSIIENIVDRSNISARVFENRITKYVDIHLNIDVADTQPVSGGIDGNSVLSNIINPASDMESITFELDENVSNYNYRESAIELLLAVGEGSPQSNTVKGQTLLSLFEVEAEENILFDRFEDTYPITHRHDIECLISVSESQPADIIEGNSSLSVVDFPFNESATETINEVVVIPQFSVNSVTDREANSYLLLEVSDSPTTNYVFSLKSGANLVYWAESALSGLTLTDFKKLDNSSYRIDSTNVKQISIQLDINPLVLSYSIVEGNNYIIITVLTSDLDHNKSVAVSCDASRWEAEVDIVRGSSNHSLSELEALSPIGYELFETRFPADLSEDNILELKVDDINLTSSLVDGNAVISDSVLVSTNPITIVLAEDQHPTTAVFSNDLIMRVGDVTPVIGNMVEGSSVLSDSISQASESLTYTEKPRETIYPRYHRHSNIIEIRVSDNNPSSGLVEGNSLLSDPTLLVTPLPLLGQGGLITEGIDVNQRTVHQHDVNLEIVCTDVTPPRSFSNRSSSGQDDWYFEVLQNSVYAGGGSTNPYQYDFDNNGIVSIYDISAARNGLTYKGWRDARMAGSSTISHGSTVLPEINVTDVDSGPSSITTDVELEENIPSIVRSSSVLLHLVSNDRQINDDPAKDYQIMPILVDSINTAGNTSLSETDFILDENWHGQVLEDQVPITEIEPPVNEAPPIIIAPPPEVIAPPPLVITKYVTTNYRVKYLYAIIAINGPAMWDYIDNTGGGYYSIVEKGIIDAIMSATNVGTKWKTLYDIVEDSEDNESSIVHIIQDQGSGIGRGHSTYFNIGRHKHLDDGGTIVDVKGVKLYNNDDLQIGGVQKVPVVLFPPEGDDEGWKVTFSNRLQLYVSGSSNDDLGQFSLSADIAGQLGNRFERLLTGQDSSSNDTAIPNYYQLMDQYYYVLSEGWINWQGSDGAYSAQVKASLGQVPAGYVIWSKPTSTAEEFLFGAGAFTNAGDTAITELVWNLSFGN